MYDAGSKIDLIFLAFGTALVSVTLTRSQLTKTFRQHFAKMPYLLGELVNCPYCVAHWVAFGFALWLGNDWQTILVNALVTAGLSVFVIGLLLRLWLWQESEIEEMRDLVREAQTEIERLSYGTQDKAA